MKDVLDRRQGVLEASQEEPERRPDDDPPDRYLHRRQKPTATGLALNVFDRIPGQEEHRRRGDDRDEDHERLADGRADGVEDRGHADMTPVPRGIGDTGEGDQDDERLVELFGEVERIAEDVAPDDIRNRVEGHQQDPDGEKHCLEPRDGDIDDSQNARKSRDVLGVVDVVIGGRDLHLGHHLRVTLGTPLVVRGHRCRPVLFMEGPCRAAIARPGRALRAVSFPSRSPRLRDRPSSGRGSPAPGRRRSRGTPVPPRRRSP